MSVVDCCNEFFGETGNVAEGENESAPGPKEGIAIENS